MTTVILRLLKRTDSAILPQVQLPVDIDFRQGIILEGRAPIWLYGLLLHLCHPAAWVATYDPRLGAVVVETHIREVRVGQVFPLKL